MREIKARLIAEYQKMMTDCYEIIDGIDTNSELYKKTVCIMNDLSQAIELLKGV